ncbi:MAG TPA: arginine deiminase family protein [Allosphingosinicella sp.]|nr:arginine deiminase family protein [Allosphingosinicella sp.]
MGFFDFTDAIVRLPADSAVDGLRAGNGPAPSLDGIRAEHDSYVEALRRIGLDVDILPPLDRHPDSMFVEDPALVFPEGAILLRPGAPSRRDEAALLEPVLRQRFEALLALDEGSADGGDVLVTPARVYIGCSNRTDEAGARALARSLGKIGRDTRIVATPPGTLHLKSDSALLGEDAVLATPALAASGAFEGFEILITPEGEESGANLVRIGRSVLVGAAFRRTIDLIAGRGLTPVPLDTTEIAKVDAGLSCMSLRW